VRHSPLSDEATALLKTDCSSIDPPLKELTVVKFMATTNTMINNPRKKLNFVFIILSFKN
jgi:hypothetical protein